MSGLFRRSAVVLALSLGISAAIPAAGALAINEVYCLENGYLDIAGYGGGRHWCYANAGEMEIDIPDAVHVHSGNNAGFIDIYKDGRTTRYVFPKWANFKVDGWADYLHIN